MIYFVVLLNFIILNICFKASIMLRLEMEKFLLNFQIIMNEYLESYKPSSDDATYSTLHDL